jgi:hypothetical protein
MPTFDALPPCRLHGTQKLLIQRHDMTTLTGRLYAMAIIEGNKTDTMHEQGLSFRNPDGAPARVGIFPAMKQCALCYR